MYCRKPKRSRGGNTRREAEAVAKLSPSRNIMLARRNFYYTLGERRRERDVAAGEMAIFRRARSC